MNEPSQNPATFDASDFAARWDAYAARTGLPHTFRPQRFSIDQPDISENTTRFLNTVGLPKGAWLRWDTDFAGRHLLEEYALDVDWSAEDRARLAPFRLLGSNAGGDPVVLDMAHD